MSLLQALSDPEVWEAFYDYKISLACPKGAARELRAYIDRQAYLPVTAAICRGEAFPLPRRGVISKLHSEKKRVVYTYPEPENTLLKLLTWLLLRRYDFLFAPGLYSFRPGRTAKDAVRDLAFRPGLEACWAFKADVSNYFNSIDLSRFLPILAAALEEDPALYAFLRDLLAEPRVLEGGREITEAKGIMAGTPQSAFFANLFLADLDRSFAQVPYARYSDDIILFAPTREAAEDLGRTLTEGLAARGLALNPDKAELFAPEEGWTFLGFRVRGREIDIAPATLDKLKAKMRRKTRALLRWQKRGGHGGEQAAAAFVRVFNRKLLEAPAGNELSWSHWFFSVITTTRSLEIIDRYAQDCLRTLVSGKRTKARYNVRYGDLKALGYRSLVHAYYAHQAQGGGEKPEAD